MSDIKFTYLKQPPSKFTFDMPKLKRWVEDRCEGKVLNLFAGKTMLGIDELRNDICIDMPAHYHLEVEEFIKMAVEKGLKFDTVILDPPYNSRKSREKYEGRYIGSFTKIKDILPQIITENGLVITFGYDTVGMSKSRGIEKIEICIICHNGDYQDTLGVMERRISNNLQTAEKSSKFKRFFK